MHMKNKTMFVQVRQMIDTINNEKLSSLKLSGVR